MEQIPEKEKEYDNIKLEILEAIKKTLYILSII